MGMTLLKTNALKTIRRILFPYSIGADMLASSMRINISGKLPNYKKKVDVQPLQWVFEFFQFTAKADPNRYNLEQLWVKN